MPNIPKTPERQEMQIPEEPPRLVRVNALRAPGGLVVEIPAFPALEEMEMFEEPPRMQRVARKLVLPPN